MLNFKSFRNKKALLQVGIVVVSTVLSCLPLGGGGRRVETSLGDILRKIKQQIMQVPNFLHTYKEFNMHLFSLEDDNIFKVYILLK